MKCLVYIQYGQKIFSFFPPWMGRPQYFDQNNQFIFSIQLFSFLKRAHKFPLFSATSLTVSKIDPTSMGSSRKRCDMHPCYPQVYCTTTSFPCQDFGKILKMHFELSGTQDMVKNSFTAHFWPGLIKCLIYSLLEGDCKSTKIGLAMGVKIGSDAEKSGNITHLLVIMNMRLFQKIGLLNLMNRTLSKKGNN